MRLAEKRKMKPLRSGDTLHAELAERKPVLLEGLLKSPFVKKIRDLIDQPEQELNFIAKETILNSWWLGMLDPTYAQKLASLPWLKEFAYSEARTLYSGEHRQYTPTVESADESEIKQRQQLYKTTAMEAIRACIQLFPEARQELGLGTKLYPQASVAEFLDFSRLYGSTPQDRLLMAVELVQVWPERRQEIIDGMVQTRERQFIQKIERAVAQHNFVDDTSLSMLLLLFPEMREDTLKNVDQGAHQILKNTESVSAGSPAGDINLFSSSTWTVIILAAEDARIDELGILQIELKQAALATPTPLPERPLA